jgi:hypothetical protein
VSSIVLSGDLSEEEIICSECRSISLKFNVHEEQIYCEDCSKQFEKEDEE